MVMGTGEIQASLQNFEFGDDVRTMLPVEVQRYWQQHDLHGQLNIPLLSYTPPAKQGGAPGYHVEIELGGVTLSVHPEEWMSADQQATLDDLHQAMDVMRLAGLNGHKFVDRVAELVEPASLNLKQVKGAFVFGDDQSIQIKDLTGWLEEM